MYKSFLFVMAALYIAAGINHFWHAAVYKAIMPPYLPWPATLVYVSGAFEILLGLLLFFRFTRRLAAIGIMLLLIAIFPANVQMAINYYYSNNPYLWIAIVRLPLQALLIWWAWYYYKWPVAKR